MPNKEGWGSLTVSGTQARPRIRIKSSKGLTGVLVANPNGVIAQKDLPEIVRVCHEITKRYGGVTHQTLYAASKRKGNAVLAKYYTQDPAKAAKKCWQQESYRILASIQIYIEQEPELPPVRYIVRVRKANEPPMFKPVTVVFSSNKLMSDMIQQALEELDLWQRKYTTLVSYSKYFKRTHARITEVVVGVREKLSGEADPSESEE